MGHGCALVSRRDARKMCLGPRFIKLGFKNQVFHEKKLEQDGNQPCYQTSEQSAGK